MQHGLIVTKVHRAIQFTELTWLAPYINFNTAKRSAATTDFERNIYKMLNNIIFGKSMQNVRKQVNVRLTTNERQFLKIMKQPTVDYFDVLSPGLTMFKLYQKRLFLNKPI